jgi:ParB/RepB/Spo0J family partition protein
MVYKEISLNLIDPSPYQTRTEYDADVLTGLATSAMDTIGIRNPPIVRPSPKKDGRYQIASGHGRVDAWKTLGHKSMMVRVENLTDSQMKKEILVENVNRSDLTEEERFEALEQYRQDLGLDKEERFISKLSKESGVPEGTLQFIYDVQHMREAILKILSAQDFEKPAARLIQKTSGLKEEERIKLVVKAMDMGWSSDTAFRVKTAIKDMEPEVRALILDEKTNLPYKVIIALSTLENPETQREVIMYVQTHKLDEELALKLIEQAKQGPLELEFSEVDEAQEIFDRFNRVYDVISGWGYNEYKILGYRWNEVLQILDKIEAKIKELRSMRYE